MRAVLYEYFCIATLSYQAPATLALSLKVKLNWSILKVKIAKVNHNQGNDHPRKDQVGIGNVPPLYDSHGGVGKSNLVANIKQQPIHAPQLFSLLPQSGQGGLTTPDQISHHVLRLRQGRRLISQIVHVLLRHVATIIVLPHPPPPHQILSLPLLPKVGVDHPIVVLGLPPDALGVLAEFQYFPTPHLPLCRRFSLHELFH